MRTDVILIGPYGAGKTTLRKLIADRLKWDDYALDDKRYHYLKEMEENYIDVSNQMSTWELSSPNWQKYNVCFVERFLLEYGESDKNCVLELGCGHSVYRDKEFFNRVQEILAPYPNVVLIRPSEKAEESLQFLLKQIRNNESKNLHRLNDEYINKDNKIFLENPSNNTLAKFVIYTKGKTPEETCEKICQLITLNPSQRT
ncbi:MAG: shikimate kinase [Chloroflexi bacterium]|nr:shikimate kinase [Chloroflexota bacterium]